MAVPNTNTFTLQDVINEVSPATNDLAACFAAANPDGFDPLYVGNKDRLSNFRNYRTQFVTDFGVTDDTHGHIWNEDETWASIREFTSGVAVVTTGDFVVGVDYGGGSYFVNRTFFTFDLTSLVGKTIISAKLEVAIMSQVGSDASLVAMKSNQSSGLLVGDFDAFDWNDFAMTSFTKVPAAGSCRAYVRLATANVAEVAMIQSAVGNRLKLAILHYNDIFDVEPSSELSYNLYRAGECISGCICLPVLTVTYY